MDDQEGEIYSDEQKVDAQTSTKPEASDPMYTNSTLPTTLSTNSAFLSVLAWGDNEGDALGLGASQTGSVLPPSRVSLVNLLPLETVVQLACGAHHALFLTSLGSVYSCGENSEGALGLGDRETRPEPVMISSDVLVDITFVSAGSGSMGSQSAAIDLQGRLFTWGVGCACGQGSTQHVLRPAPVQLSESNEHDEPQTTETRWIKVACGGGFCVGITSDLRLFSWGMWATGRLGKTD
jgi:alpha-tubulin suppressor-like RCC1 family protein